MSVKPRGSTYGTVTLSASPEDVMKVLAARLAGNFPFSGPYNDAEPVSNSSTLSVVFTISGCTERWI